MRRAYLGVVLAVVLPAFSTYAQGMRGGERGGFHGGAMGRSGSFASHGGFAGHFASSRGGFVYHGGFGGRHFVYHGRGVGYGFVRGRGFGVTVYGGGYGYPYGCAFPYCYSYPYPASGAYYASTPDSGYDLPVDESADQDAQVDPYANQNAQGYYQVGNQWGGELKGYRLTVDQLATYLKSYVIPASPAQQAAFRSGFVASAAPGAAAVYDQAMQEASQ